MTEKVQEGIMDIVKAVANPSMDLRGILTTGKDLFFLYTFIKKLSTPFRETKAYKLGIIDKKGKVLIKRKDLETKDQKNAYTILDTFVFNMKKILAKVPFANTRLATFAAALFLLKEENKLKTNLVESVIYISEDSSKLEKKFLPFYDSVIENKAFLKECIDHIEFKKELVKQIKEGNKESDKENPVAKKWVEHPDWQKLHDMDDKMILAYIKHKDFKEDAPANSTSGIAGAGDDSSTVPVGRKAQKKIRKRNQLASIMRLKREASYNLISRGV